MSALRRQLGFWVEIDADSVSISTQKRLKGGEE
jgi:hypothetical protein